MKRFTLALFSMMLFCTNAVQTLQVMAEEEDGTDAGIQESAPDSTMDPATTDENNDASSTNMDPQVTDETVATSDPVTGADQDSDTEGQDDEGSDDSSAENAGDDTLTFNARSSNVSSIQAGTFYNADGSSYSITDLGMTLTEAAEALAIQDFYSQMGVMMLASSPLYRVARVAEFHNAYNGLPEYVSMFTMNGRPVYCIEPYVALTLDGAGNGPVYDSTSWSDLDDATKDVVGRIMWYGYGHPMSGTSERWYMATQLLVWKYVAPSDYAEIAPTLKECTPMDQACAVTGGALDVSSEMETIMNLVNNRDTVPSFANEWHGIESYDLDWNETLTLTDTNNVLSWFNDNSVESHKGINIKRDGNKLLIDIDDLHSAISSHTRV